jgi:DNA-binding NarL/FixJ family response regulator
MSAGHLTLDQIRRVGLEVLSRELGVVGMVRFLQLSEVGSGDYSVERHSWLEKSDVRGLADKIRRKRSGQTAEVAAGSSLNAREQEIVALVAQGFKNKQIADALSLTSESVKVHLAHIFKKTGVKDRFELAMYGRQTRERGGTT